MDRFLSKDKKIINLPVPIGSEIFYYTMDCGDFCLHQRTLFQSIKKQMPERMKCGHASACKTMKPCIHSKILTLKNLEMILDYWDDWFFATKNEAEKRASRLVEENIRFLKEKGFVLREDGYSEDIEKDFGSLGTKHPQTGVKNETKK